MPHDLKGQSVKCEEAQELITGLVDNELSPRESELITAHFGECGECPKSYSQEYALKCLVQNAARSTHARSELRDRILNGRGRRAPRAWLAGLGEVLSPLRGLAVQGAVLAALLAVPFFTARYWLASPHLPIVPGMFQQYREIIGGETAPAKMTNLDELKENLTQLVDGRFAPMAYDLSTMNFHLVGGMLRKIANRQVLVTVYQGNGSTILCFTFLGSEGDVPDVAQVFLDAAAGMNFYQFQHAQTNAVMHREGIITCVLMSQIPMSDLLQLARAKAHAS